MAPKKRDHHSEVTDAAHDATLDASTHATPDATPHATNATAEYASIYAVVQKIPRGKVATYGQIALLAGMPRAARQAGLALRVTPDNIKIPWHRVVNAQGRVSRRLADWESGSDDYQRVLLENEGVEFSAVGRAGGKIDLKKFRWMPKA